MKELKRPAKPGGWGYLPDTSSAWLEVITLQKMYGRDLYRGEAVLRLMCSLPDCHKAGGFYGVAFITAAVSSCGQKQLCAGCE